MNKREKRISKREASGKMGKDAASGGVGAILATLLVGRFLPDLDPGMSMMAMGALTGGLTGSFKFVRNIAAQWLRRRGWSAEGNFIR